MPKSLREIFLPATFPPLGKQKTTAMLLTVQHTNESISFKDEALKTKQKTWFAEDMQTQKIRKLTCCRYKYFEGGIFQTEWAFNHLEISHPQQFWL